MSTSDWDPSTHPPDVAVLVALKEEFRELCGVWGAPTTRRNETYGGEDYLFVAPREGGRPYRVIVFVMSDMGPSASTHGADRLLAANPAVIVSLGIACSLDAKDLRLCDVIVANQIDGYDEKGKATARGRGRGWTFKRGGEVYRATDDVTRLADQLEFGEPEVFGRWQTECEQDLVAGVGEDVADRASVDALVADRQLRRRPGVVKAHLASGVSVAAATQFREWILERDRNIKALEMEAVGVLRAAHERRNPVPTLVLRGVSDLGDADKAKLDAIGDGALRRVAMRNAVRFLLALMKTGRLPQGDGPSRRVEHERAPPPSSVVQGGVLPRMEHAFVGRQEEVTRLREAMLSQPPASAVLLGPGGFGKSTIAVQALRDERVAAAFGPRRYFVRLDAAKDDDEAAELIARQLRITVRTDPLAEVVDVLAFEPAALVLDNYESIWSESGSGKLVTRLAEVEGLALVVTVRSLNPPPGVPSLCKIVAKRFTIDESVELFTAISDYPDTPELRALLAELDGVPLAVQLLAHAAPPGALSVLAADWRQRKTALLEREGAGDDRAWSWKASLELSWSAFRMTDAARRAASVLAVLPDGLAEEDFDPVLPAEGPTAASVLLRCGLAYLEAGRLRMLAPVREHVRAHHPPTPADHLRAAEHYRELALDLGPRPGAEGGLEATRRLAPEVSNLDVMIRHGLEDPEPMRWIQAAAALRSFACFSGLSHPNPIDRAAVRAREIGDVQGQANCIKRLGDIALRRSEHGEARALYEQAKPLYERVGAVVGQANCIQSLGDIALARSKHEEARALYEQAKPLYECVGAVLGQAHCVQSLGDIALRRSEHEEARALYEQAKPLYERMGDVLGQANCIQSLGDIALARWEHEEARALYEQAKPLYERVGAVLGQANCIKRLGDIALARSEHGQARALYEQAKPLYERVGDVLGQANCIQCLGDLALERSEHEARALYEQALALYGSIPEPHSMGATRVRLARVARSDAERATHVAEARRLWAPLGMPHLLRFLDERFGSAGDES